jgi:Phosphotransferase enzyme family
LVADSLTDVEPPQATHAVAVATAIAASVDLSVDGVTVLHNSNKLALRLLPCDVMARVAPVAHQDAEFEIALAQRLAGAASPVAALDPRFEPRPYERDGFVVTWWTYYEPGPQREISAAEYAGALARLHAGMRTLEVATPHFTDRVAEAQELLADRDRTPELADEDRHLLAGALADLTRAIRERGAAEQVLHGEPHPANLLATKDGPLFIDLETCCRGPVEFDLAHAPDEVSADYPGVDEDLLRDCRLLKLAMITTWRWDRDDQFPGGRQLGIEQLSELRTALERDGSGTGRSGPV